jgi:uncharacterized iron-regulated membrane protein
MSTAATVPVYGVQDNGEIDCLYLGNPIVTALIILLVICVVASGWYYLKKRKPAQK